MTVPLPATYSVEEVAAALGETPRFVQQKCRSRQWPHLRGARGRISFTAQQYAEVLELLAQTPEADEPAPRMAFAPRSRRRPVEPPRGRTA